MTKTMSMKARLIVAVLALGTALSITSTIAAADASARPIMDPGCKDTGGIYNGYSGCGPA